MGEIIILMACIYCFCMCICLIILKMKSKRKQSQSVQDVCDWCISNIDNYRYARLCNDEMVAYEYLSEHLQTIKKKSRGLKGILEYEESNDSDSLILGIINAFTAHPNADKFEKIDALFNALADDYNSMSVGCQQMAEVRNELRNIAIQDMRGIASLVDCFSAQLVEVTSHLSADESVGSLPMLSEYNWSNQVRAFNPETTDIGSSLFEAGANRGGVAGTGMMALGGIVAVGEAIVGNAQREANYANAITQRSKDIRAIVKEAKNAKVIADKILEFSNSLQMFHTVYVSQVTTLASKIAELPERNVARSENNPYPVKLDDSGIQVMLRLVEAYNNVNQRAVEIANE